MSLMVLWRSVHRQDDRQQDRFAGRTGGLISRQTNPPACRWTCRVDPTRDLWTNDYTQVPTVGRRAPHLFNTQRGGGLRAARIVDSFHDRPSNAI
jgi:hypothetical protein